MYVKYLIIDAKTRTVSNGRDARNLCFEKFLERVANCLKIRVQFNEQNLKVFPIVFNLFAHSGSQVTYV